MAGKLIEAKIQGAKNCPHELNTNCHESYRSEQQCRPFLRPGRVRSYGDCRR